MDHVNSEEFGVLLKRYRMRRRMNQVQLADPLHLAPSNISRWESGRRNPPDRDTILALAGTLNLEAKDTNLLLAAAGYMQVEGRGIDFGDPLLRALATILAGELAQPDKALLRLQLARVIQMWTRHAQVTSAGDTAPRTNRDTYEHLLEVVTDLHDLSRLPLLAALGRACAQQSQYLEAQVWYERAKEAAGRTGVSHWSAEMSVQIGNILRLLGQRQAITHYQEAEQIFASIPNVLAAARCRRKQASAFLYLGIETQEKAYQVESLLQENIRELTRMGQDLPGGENATQAELFNTYSYLGWFWSLQGRSEEGLDLRQKALDIARTLCDNYRLSVGHRLLGDDHENRGNLDEAEVNYRTALEFTEHIDLPVKRQRERGKVERGLGSTLTKQQRYEEADRHLSASLTIFRDLEDDLNMAWTLNEIGKLHAVQDNLGRALDAHWVARTVFQALGNDYYTASAGLEVAEVHALQGDADKAKELADVAQAIAAERGHKRLLARALEACAYFTLLQEEEYEGARAAYDAFCATVLEIGAIAEYEEKLVRRMDLLLQQRRYAVVEELSTHLARCCQASAGGRAVKRLAAQLEEYHRRAQHQEERARRPAEVAARIDRLVHPLPTAAGGVG